MYVLIFSKTDLELELSKSRWLLPILFFISSQLLCFSQDTLNLERFYPKPKITAYEILVGLNFSTIRGISPTIGSVGNDVYYATTPNYNTGYSLGVGLVHTFSKHFELHAKFLWETKGINQKTDSLLLSVSTSSILGAATISSQNTNGNYITISILPQLLLGKRSHFNIGVGGYFGILQQSKTTIEYFYPVPRSVTQIGYFNKDDFGLVFNLGYTFYFKKDTRFTIQFVNNYGIKQISKFHDLYSWSPPLYNNSHSIMLGIRLVNNRNFTNKTQ